MQTTLTDLRAHLYQRIDELIATGVPIEVNRKGHHLKIILEAAPAKLKKLIRRENIIIGDPEDLVHMDWSQEWKGGQNDLY
jgi:hypothetical protein